MAWRDVKLIRCETGLAYFSPLVLLVDATEGENHTRGRMDQVSYLGEVSPLHMYLLESLKHGFLSQGKLQSE